MTDPVKQNAIHTDFSAEKIVKVPAEISFKKGLGFMQFNPAFVNLEILAAHLLKSDEWIYGIYYGANFHGFIYPGEKLSQELQFSSVQKYLPIDKNDLPDYQKKYFRKIEYHNSEPDSYAIIGELSGRNVIQKTKK